MLTRRGFLVYMGAGTYAMMRSLSKAHASVFPLARGPRKKISKFDPIPPSSKDALILPKGFRYEIVCTYGDPLGSSGPQGPETFGYDNDFIAYFPIDALKGGKDAHHGLLWVNHEYVNPLFVSGSPKGHDRTAEQLREEHQSVGGSVLEVRREKGKWRMVPRSKYARRFTADYPLMRVTGPAASAFTEMAGTLANCSGGRTYWNTALSGEENFHLFNMKAFPGLNWGAVPGMAIREECFGWIVEADPFGELPPAKHTALGRFAHENAALRVGGSGRLVVYMGDDCPDQFLYKYVSEEKYQPSSSRAQQSALLSSGTLYAADFLNGKWLPLDFKRNPIFKKVGFKSQAEVLLRTRDAAQIAGATPVDRPEDCEVNPFDGSVYIALTNNGKHGDVHGQIVRLVEEKDDAEAGKFRFEIFVAGGPQSGLSCPDNLTFDKDRNLWVTCDVSSYSLNKGPHACFGNNGLFMVPTQGAATGDAYQFASGPVECELTGPWFNESYDTLFLSVQHPGEETTDLNQPTSRWPSGKGAPRPSVVAITGF